MKRFINLQFTKMLFHKNDIRQMTYLRWIIRSKWTDKIVKYKLDVSFIRLYLFNWIIHVNCEYVTHVYEFRVYNHEGIYIYTYTTNSIFFKSERSSSMKFFFDSIKIKEIKFQIRSYCWILKDSSVSYGKKIGRKLIFSVCLCFFYYYFHFCAKKFINETKIN